ncbi:hypothetical protein DFH09DRAFT_1409738 [Mycena vulgaris]|nr:hypothetical protein DFH09DRAFT_1409738 [Mycena vulgaris]
MRGWALRCSGGRWDAEAMVADIRTIESFCPRIRMWGARLIEMNPFEGALFSWTREGDAIEGKAQGVEYLAVRVTERKTTGALAMMPRGWKEVMARAEKDLLEADG